jgi:hypothetical protein
MPMGLTRSMEEEFRHNADGKFFDVFRYVVYEAWSLRPQRPQKLLGLLTP